MKDGAKRELVRQKKYIPWDSETNLKQIYVCIQYVLGPELIHTMPVKKSTLLNVEIYVLMDWTTPS